MQGGHGHGGGMPGEAPNDGRYGQQDQLYLFTAIPASRAQRA